MVEAPRIRILYENIKFTKNKIITRASGATYKKFNLDLVGYKIRKWWFVGKYIFTHIIKENFPTYVIRTHMMMYGKIVINNNQVVNPKLVPFMFLELDDNTTLTWYLTQIRLLDPYCLNDQIRSNYTTCSSKEIIDNSIVMMKYDISNRAYNYDTHIKHLKCGLKKHPNDIVVDFLLDQKYFPGIGNILQQEALYRCRIFPTKLLSKIDNDMLKCLIQELKNVINQLYQSYLDKISDKPHQPILQIYHKSLCPLGHKTITKYLGYHNRRTTYCPICQI
jgi:formamidopyrimidine-DNA glycosylase